MNTCGVFTVNEVQVNLRSSRETWNLIPIGDIHRDSPQCAADRWQEDIAEWKSIPNKLLLGMGDYTDMLSTTERKIIGNDGLHESTREQIEQHSRDWINRLSKEMASIGGTWLGLLGGNHYFSFEDGSTGDHMLARNLKTRFLGVASFVRLVFKWPSSNRRASITIFAHHGKGGGARLVGGSMNTVAQSAEFTDADICLMGHDHRRGILPLNPIIGLSTNRNGELRVVERQRWVGRTGSYLKAYTPDRRSYNVDAGRGPCSLGHIRFELTAIREDTHGTGGQDTIRIQVRGVA